PGAGHEGGVGPAAAHRQPAQRQRDEQAQEERYAGQPAVLRRQLEHVAQVDPEEGHRPGISCASLTASTSLARTVPTRRPSGSTRTPRPLGDDSAAASIARSGPSACARVPPSRRFSGRGVPWPPDVPATASSRWRSEERRVGNEYRAEEWTE